MEKNKPQSTVITIVEIFFFPSVARMRHLNSGFSPAVFILFRWTLDLSEAVDTTDKIAQSVLQSIALFLFLFYFEKDSIPPLLINHKENTEHKIQEHQ